MGKQVWRGRGRNESNVQPVTEAIEQMKAEWAAGAGVVQSRCSQVLRGAGSPHEGPSSSCVAVASDGRHGVIRR